MWHGWDVLTVSSADLARNSASEAIFSAEFLKNISCHMRNLFAKIVGGCV